MLYIISTPIGNLGDITYRAVETLQKAEIILCEDTRHSRILTDKFNCKGKLFAYHKFNETEKLDYVLNLLHENKEIALITDAGTPIISDPGYVLVEKVKEENLPYTAIPGACAAINALVLSGMNSQHFTFVGFLPKTKRNIFLEKFKDIENTLIFYIPPHAVNHDLESIFKVFGERKGVLCKEMTKIYEDKIDVLLSEKMNLDLKGEMVFILEGKKINENALFELSPMEHLMGYINSGMNKKEAIKRVAKERNVPKNEIYSLLNK